MEENISLSKKKADLLRKVLYISLTSAFAGGALTFIFLSASPEKSLHFGAQSTNSLSGGIGILGFFGALVWNTLIAFFGSIFSGFIAAIGALIYYSFFNKENQNEQ